MMMKMPDISVRMLSFLTLSLLTTGLLAGHIQIVQALQQTDEWEIGNTYQISIITSENWQPSTPFEVTVRFMRTSALCMCTETLYTTETNSFKVVLSSEDFVMESENQTVHVAFTKIGDYWERKASFQISDKLNRGQTLNVSVVAIIDIDEVAIRTGHHSNKVWNNYDDPVIVSLHRPLLLTWEWYLTCILAAIIAAGIGFLLYRRRQTSARARRFLQETSENSTVEQPTKANWCL